MTTAVAAAAERPKRIQRKRTRGWKMPPNAVSVTRPGKYGNPFSSNTGLAPSDCVWLCREWLEGRLEPGSEVTMPDGSIVEVPDVPPIEELRGKDVACFCGPGDPCHGDLYLELANPVDPGASP